MADRLRDHDWSATAFGPVASWPPPLRAAVSLCLHSSFPTAIYWGPELRLLYNDAWAPIPGDRHPAALGRPGAEVWDDIWHVVGPQFHHVLNTGRGFSTFDQMLPMRRRGVTEETYWNYSFTPILNDDGSVGGVLNQGNETTDRILTGRSQAFLLDVGDRIRSTAAAERDPAGVLVTALEAVGLQFGVRRAGYAEIDPDGIHSVVLAYWSRPGVAPMTRDRYRIADFGEAMMADALVGRVVAVDDVSEDPRVPPAARKTFLRLDVRANLLVPITRNGRTFALLFVNDDTPRRWTWREIDTLRDVAERMWLGFAQARALAQVRESGRRFAALFGQAPIGLAEADLGGRLVRANAALGDLLGRSPDDLRGITVADITHADDREESARRMAEAAATGEPFQIEKRYLRPDSSVVWGVTNVARLVDERDRPSGFLAVTADITERREAERVRALLLAELNHRVKNNLATVQAIASHTRRSAASPAEFEALLNARLMALSRAHDLLTREAWTGASLIELATRILATYGDGAGGPVAISGPDVRLSPTAAVTLTMALHELASNAARFGALSAAGGRVAVDWLVDGGVVDLSWRETGGPAVSPPARRGYGRRLLENGVALELGGEARLDFAAGGLTFALRLPLSRKVMLPKDAAPS